MKRALSCITDAHLFTSGGSWDEDHALTLSQDPLQLRSALHGDLKLKIAHQFRYVQEDRSDWHVSTVQYAYRLDDGDGNELISWHWHPHIGATFPHLHFSGGPISHKAHVPSGRVSIEAVLRLLLDDLKVQPTQAHADDYLEVLEECERPFIRYRRWHA